MGIERVFVAGAGFMGHGIAQVSAAAGKQVALYEPEVARAEAGLKRIAGNLDRAVSKGKLDASNREAILGRIRPTDQLAGAADVELVIEAVYEDLAVKTELWRQLDSMCPPETLFATNTSSISIDRLAQSLGPERRSRFVGMHFFSPVPVMPLVELIRGSETSQDTESAIRALSAELGKQVIVSADSPGFIVNRTLMPFLREAMLVYEQGIASADDIDTGARVGLNHPMGPLELSDFIGLDVCLGVMRVLEQHLGDPRYAPPQVLEELVAAGKLGQKTGEGFYRYPRG